MIESETTYEVILVLDNRERPLVMSGVHDLERWFKYYVAEYPNGVFKVTKTTYCKVCGGTGQVSKKRNPLARGKCPSCNGKNNYLTEDVTEEFMSKL